MLGKTHTPELMQWPFTESATFGRHAQPVGHRAHAGRLQRRLRRGRRGRARGRRARDRRRRLDPHPRRLLRRCSGSSPSAAACRRRRVEDGWQGLTTIGCVTRSVRDTALYLDVVADHATASRSREAARARARARCGSPARRRTRCSRRSRREQRGAYEETIELLRSLGHTVEQRATRRTADILSEVIPRYLRGVADDAGALPHPERLERRTRAMARMGRLLPPQVIARARAHEAATTARLGRVFADHDVLLTPALAALPLPVGRYEGRGALWTFNGVARFTPYTPAWNVTGQPAASVPAGFTPEGVPLAVQLVGRPGDEATLLSLSRSSRRRGRGPSAGPRSRRERRRCGSGAAGGRASRARRRWLARFERPPRVGTKSTATDPSATPIAPPSRRSARCWRAPPGDAILGEEGGETARGASGVRWVVDPLDGTVNYLFGYPQWSVSVACEDATGRSRASCSTRCATRSSRDALRAGAARRRADRPRVAPATSRRARRDRLRLRRGGARAPGGRARARAAARARHPPRRQRRARPRLDGVRALRRLLRARRAALGRRGRRARVRARWAGAARADGARWGAGGLLAAPPALAGSLLALVLG